MDLSKSLVRAMPYETVLVDKPSPFAVFGMAIKYYGTKRDNTKRDNTES